MDGVIYHGNQILPGVPEFIQWLHDEKKEYLFLTNNSGYTPRELNQKLARMGLDVPEEHFYTSALATAAFLKEQAAGCSAFVIGEAGLLNALYDVGITMNDVNPDYVVVGEGRSYSLDTLTKATNLVLKGAKLIGANSDVSGPIENGIAPACRALIAPIEMATGTQAYFCGKPNPLMMRTGLNMLGCHSAEAVMVGDRMDTDVISGMESGMSTVLVLSGCSTKDTLKTYAYRPTMVLNGVGDIVMLAKSKAEYASFMKRFTGHKEEWGTFLDVKHWPEIKNPKKYAGQRVVIGSVTDGYNPQEEQFGNTRKLLEQLIGSDADILICTKSDLVVRDIDLLKKLGRVTVSWSINTLDENFKNDMDSASSIEHRIAAMKQVYEAGIRTVCFVSPVFPGITDFEAIFERVKDQCDLFWLENLNLRGDFKKTIMDYIAGKYPDLVPLYDEIYNKHNRSYFEALEVKAEKMAKKYDCAFVDNEMPYGRVPQGHPVIVDYFYHEEIRGTENTGKRNR